VTDSAGMIKRSWVARVCEAPARRGEVDPWFREKTTEPGPRVRYVRYRRLRGPVPPNATKQMAVRRGLTTCTAGRYSAS
jgi:hypothetical protein